MAELPEAVVGGGDGTLAKFVVGHVGEGHLQHADVALEAFDEQLVLGHDWFLLRVSEFRYRRL